MSGADVHCFVGQGMHTTQVLEVARKVSDVEAGVHEQYLEHNDHVKVAQVEANPFQVDNGNSRHGHNGSWDFYKLY